MEARALSLTGIICRNLYRQPLRSSLTVLGVSLGIIAMVAISSVVRGLWAASQKSITAGGTDLLVFQAGVAGDIFSVLDETKTRAALMSTPGVAEVAAALTHVMPVEGKPFFIVFGIHPGEYSSQQNRIVEGRMMKAENEVLLGKLAKSALKKKVGDAITLAGREFTVAGIYETDVVFYNGAVLVNLPALQSLIKRPGQVTAFQVKVAAGQKPIEVSWRIESDHKDLVAIGSAAQYNKVDAGLDIVDAVQAAVSILVTLVGGLVVLNTMWMSVHERTRELGVLRALGWSQRRVVAMILAESTAVGIAACIVGSPLGCLLANVTTQWSLTNRFVQPVFGFGPFVVAGAVGLAMSLLGGFAPAWRASRISPAEALRYE